MDIRAWLVPVIGGMAILLAPGGPAAARSPQQGSAAVVRGHADIGTAKLYYEVRGSGRPLVLLHGGLSSSEDFEAVINAYYPTTTDMKLTGLRRNVLKAIGGWRYHLKFYDYPLELRALQKLFAYQRPETTGF